MNEYFILGIIFQAAAVIHCLKTGRSWIWIWVIVLLSYIGVLAYVAVEILPELFRGRGAQRTARSLKSAINPQADLRRFEDEMRVTGDVDSHQRYADELTRLGRYDEAIGIYRQIRTGLYEHDPKIMLGLARALFEKGEAQAARETLDELIRHNPDFQSPEGHLLYARALEAEGNFEKALEEYKVLEHSYPGAEAPVRYAQLLKAQGREAEARKVVKDLLEEARIAPAHYRRVQKEWLDAAKRLM